jgi:hypothetical protein
MKSETCENCGLELWRDQINDGINLCHACYCKINLKEKTPKFSCGCNGCRRYPRNVAQAYYGGEGYLSSVTNGHFFSYETMRWFRSRISQISLLSNPLSDDSRRQGIAVILSNKRDAATPREYELVTVCQWGEITRQHADSGGILHYENLRQARKALGKAEYPACTCHGCMLDASELAQIV